MLKKKINNNYEYEYYICKNKIEESLYKTKDDNENELNFNKISKNEYNEINDIKTGGEARSEENLKIGNYIIKNIFKYDILYELILPLIEEYNIEIEKKIEYEKEKEEKSSGHEVGSSTKSIKMFITGGASLITLFETEYINKFKEEQLKKYKELFDKTDIDAQVIINIKKESDKHFSIKP